MKTKSPHSLARPCWRIRAVTRVSLCCGCSCAVCHPALIRSALRLPLWKEDLSGDLQLQNSTVCSTWDLSRLLLCRSRRPGWVPASVLLGPQTGWEVTYPQSCVDSQGHTRSELGEALLISGPTYAMQVVQGKYSCDSGVWQIQPPPAV